MSECLHITGETGFGLSGLGLVRDPGQRVRFVGSGLRFWIRGSDAVMCEWFDVNWTVAWATARFSLQLESLILAQNERWRQA